MRNLTTLAAMVMALACMAAAQVQRGVGIVPPSGIERPQDVGVRMHTNYLIYAPDGVVRPQASPGGETPGSLGCVYDLVSAPIAGCPIATATEVPTGGSGVIVIVAAMNLALDFDQIASCAGTAPRYMEWYGAFGLMVTIVWLYIEILRLLGNMRSRN